MVSITDIILLHNYIVLTVTRLRYIPENPSASIQFQMSLGQVRLRPKANKPSINNMSAMEGGLWGREPPTYGHRNTNDPYGVVPHGGGGGGDFDFLSRVEKAEARDSERERNRSKGHRAFARRSMEGGMMDDGGGVSFGGDNMTNQRAVSSHYQTSNSAVNEQMQKMHEHAVQRHHEQTIRTLLREQHGLSEAEAEQEIKLWRQEVEAGKAAPIPSGDAAAPKVEARRAARGENGQFLQQTDFDDPFKVRAVRSATPPKPKPWEIEDGFKQRSTSKTPKQKVRPFEVADPFKSRTSASPPNAYSNHAAGEYKMASGSSHSQFHVDPNASSTVGGIFG